MSDREIAEARLRLHSTIWTLVGGMGSEKPAEKVMKAIDDLIELKVRDRLIKSGLIVVRDRLD